MVSRLNGHKFEQAWGDGEGQGSLACCSPWGHKESDMIKWLNNNSNPDPGFHRWFCLCVSALVNFASLNLSVCISNFESSYLPVTSHLWQIQEELLIFQFVQFFTHCYDGVATYKLFICQTKTKSSHSFSSWYDGGAIFLLLRQHYLSIISDFSIVHILIKYQLSPAGSVLWMYLEFEYILPSLLSSETALTWLEQFSFLPVFLLRLLTDTLNLKRSAGVTLSNC